jgi:hypothetical protein
MGDRFEGEAAGARTEAADRRYDDRHREGNMSHAMRRRWSSSKRANSILHQCRNICPNLIGGNPLIPSPSCRDTLAADDLFTNEAAWVAVREIV